ncbi:hypothetical protein CPTAKMNP4_213 [Salmonella phage vB_SenM-AKM_NP4]|nr:hypothetical protein I133_gp059 [Salmonella phage vB_SenM-S16]YP_009286571.1 hypothetical protein BI049_gp174 [Salmonella phage vB_SnwM_CGG4-1]UFK27075.1 hypothetical protein LG358_00054 [Escherichia phage UoN_LG358_1]WDR21874.1 hypothetical protein PJM34_0206 [Salmonella phage vB_SenM_UTK0003]WKV23561.1 hypothetical protein SEA1_gp0213 [Salmonella phage SEA1]WLI71835.1 hypothetical protein CPTAKMNP4_213 [Salmonella phage vB_SenM-AKM_NP4]AEO97142.1 hypothetical protein [Salmonella phage vB
MNNLKEIFDLITEIEKKQEYLFCAYCLNDGTIGLDIMDYDNEELIGGGIFKSVEIVLEYLEEYNV